MLILVTVTVTGRQERAVIVGGGVLGTMHAVMARRRGFDVVQLEREPEARGASVRNFGLIWVSGRKADQELTLALRARSLWEEVAREVPGIGFRPAGSLTIATDDAELRVLREAAQLPDAKLREFELLDPAEVRAVNPALRGDFLGGLRCRADAVVEPRLALPALRASLAGPGYRWLPGLEAVAVDPHGVQDHTGRWHRGDLVVLCTGASFTGVAGPHLAATGALTGGNGNDGGSGLRRVRLQMLQTEPFAGHLSTSVADGDSLRYYPAYDTPGRALLGPQPPAAAAARAQLLLVQRADGGLTIGDTHDYDEPFPFDLDEDAYDHLRARAEALLGTPLPKSQRRWAGVYSEVTGPGGLYHRSDVAPGVVLVTGPGGRGMTCSPAIAEETFG
ncbi:MAG: FAD-dependent oxidoreductase [Actinobacteria bacterium]|nr:FAD-dependent oxidoreductase [Actinomycetota bacterium]